MKKTLLILSFITGMSTVHAQNVTIPDPNFKAFLVADPNINLNSDTEIQVSEATAFTGMINCNTQNVTDFTGLEAFVNLTSLIIVYNPVTTLDISQNTALTLLNVYINSLTSLDVSNNVLLQELRTERNPIMNLDISNLTQLKTLTCGNNGLTSLDLTNNVNLEIADLTGSAAYGNMNQIASLDVSNCADLTFLSLGGNLISSLDVSNNTNLETLYCNNLLLTSIDVSANVNLDYLDCSTNNITSLNVSNNTSLTRLVFSNNPITGGFDLSGYSNLIAIGCNGTEISSLNIANGNNTNFTTMRAYSNPNLTCIQVDDATWSTTNWNAWDNVDAGTSFSENCSGTAAINELESIDLKVYPNPTSNYVTIESKNIIISIEIVDLSGALVQTETQNSFSIEQLTNGVYLMNIKTDSGTVTKRLIKE